MVPQGNNPDWVCVVVYATCEALSATPKKALRDATGLRPSTTTGTSEGMPSADGGDASSNVRGQHTKTTTEITGDLDDVGTTSESITTASSPESGTVLPGGSRCG